MIHFYSGEVQPINTWPQSTRYDHKLGRCLRPLPHCHCIQLSQQCDFVIPINSLWSHLFIDGTRRKLLRIWRVVRVLRLGSLAMLAPENALTDEAWAQHLASDLITRTYDQRMGTVGRRLRRNYFGFLRCCLELEPKVITLCGPRLTRFSGSCYVGIVPVWMVFEGGFQRGIAIFAIGTVSLREATGEVLPQHEFSLRPLRA